MKRIVVLSAFSRDVMSSSTLYGFVWRIKISKKTRIQLNTSKPPASLSLRKEPNFRDQSLHKLPFNYFVSTPNKSL